MSAFCNFCDEIYNYKSHYAMAWLELQVGITCTSQRNKWASTEYDMEPQAAGVY
jgi:hypothetical protein